LTSSVVAPPVQYKRWQAVQEKALVTAKMKILVTGSADHLGEALTRTLRSAKYEVAGLDVLESPFTTQIGLIADRSCVRQCMSGVKIVFHAATLHKPHVVTHRAQEFVDANITGTLNLLEEAVNSGVESFIVTWTLEQTYFWAASQSAGSWGYLLWIAEKCATRPRKRCERSRSIFINSICRYDPCPGDNANR
jgi:UDP-glucose 4-epimerase